MSTRRARNRTALPSELEAALARIAELEARDADHERSQQVQSALYRIAETASAAQDMPSFYAAIHAIVGEVMYAENFYIALYDDQRRLISYPYVRDTVDDDWPDPQAWIPFGAENAAGATAYVLRNERSVMLDLPELERLTEAGEIVPTGTESVEWLAAPLIADGRTAGLVALQTYREDRRYRSDDLEVLTFVAQHIATALTRARAIEETRQRNAELAVVNEIGLALAKQLDFQGIIELVGERIGTIFAVDSLEIALLDRATNRFSTPYSVEEGTRLEEPDRELGIGLTSQVIESRAPLRVNSMAEAIERGAIVTGDPDLAAKESSLRVPILASGTVLGVVGLSRTEPWAFSESDERLLSTIASSMGVAMENARLFDETKRLLTETEQRNAELSMINEIGSALAKQLDLDAIIEIVGERVRKIFRAETMFIGLYEAETNLVRFPYEIGEGTRYHTEPIELGEGLSSIVIRSKRALRIGNNEQSAELGAITYDEIETQSWVGVPIPAGDRVIGLIGLESVEKNAYLEADERLLATFASSMGVALENARLFDETKRLLTETDERAAELAVVNSVQQGLAQNLDMQSMYELVGDKIQEIFDAQVVDIGIFDIDANLINFPYAIERGVRYPDQPVPIGGYSEQLITRAEPIHIADFAAWSRETGQDLQPIQGEPALSLVAAPLFSGGAVRGRISLQNLDRTHAFTDADVRLLSTLAGSLSV
ncbi:MAG: GAF domain-containing protein, partial [Chloroflexota bacterium]